MDANQYVVVARHAPDANSMLARWERGSRGRSSAPWLVGAVLIALGLLAAVTVAASLLLRPDYGFHYGPTAPGGPSPEPACSACSGRNSLVLALHAAACVAGFIAGADPAAHRPSAARACRGWSTRRRGRSRSRG